jgi:cytochrome c oxidase assembly protein subunit 15
VAFASLALAVLLSAALAPPDRGALRPLGIVFAVCVVLDIALGALFEATDAAVVWDTFPAYGDALLPSSDRLFAFSPAWRNLTENTYLIQAGHRMLSYGLWLVALGALAVSLVRGGPRAAPLLLFGLLSLDGALGVATLLLAEPPALSIAHQVCGVLVLAAALACFRAPTANVTAPAVRSVHMAPAIR